MKSFGIILTILMAVALLGFAEKSSPSEQAFLQWDISSSLGLFGGPTAEQIAVGKPSIRSAEEIGFIKEAEEAACLRYRKVSALYRVAAVGGEAEKKAATGYALSRAQARSAWVEGHASATVARLEQSVEFAKSWADAAQAAYDAGKVPLSESIAASEADAEAKQSLDRVRRALMRLGYDLKDVSEQPRIDVKHPSLEDCGLDES